MIESVEQPYKSRCSGRVVCAPQSQSQPSTISHCLLPRGGRQKSRSLTRKTSVIQGRQRREQDTENVHPNVRLVYQQEEATVKYSSASDQTTTVPSSRDWPQFNRPTTATTVRHDKARTVAYPNPHSSSSSSIILASVKEWIQQIKEDGQAENCFREALRAAQNRGLDEKARLRFGYLWETDSSLLKLLVGELYDCIDRLEEGGGGEQRLSQRATIQRELFEQDRNSHNHTGEEDQQRRDNNEDEIKAMAVVKDCKKPQKCPCCEALFDATRVNLTMNRSCYSSSPQPQLLPHNGEFRIDANNPETLDIAYEITKAAELRLAKMCKDLQKNQPSPQSFEGSELEEITASTKRDLELAVRKQLETQALLASKEILCRDLSNENQELRLVSGKEKQLLMRELRDCANLLEQSRRQIAALKFTKKKEEHERVVQVTSNASCGKCKGVGSGEAQQMQAAEEAASRELFEKYEQQCNGRIQACEDLKVVGELVLDALAALLREEQLLPAGLADLRDEFESKRLAIIEKVADAETDQQLVIAQFVQEEARIRNKRGGGKEKKEQEEEQDEEQNNIINRSQGETRWRSTLSGHQSQAAAASRMPGVTDSTECISAVSSSDQRQRREGRLIAVVAEAAQCEEDERLLFREEMLQIALAQATAIEQLLMQ